MRSTRHRPTRSISRSVVRVLPLAALAALAVAQPAGALPTGTGGQGDPPPPGNHAPVARFTITPNPALVTTTPQISVHNARIVGGVNPGLFGRGDVVKFNAATSTDDHGIVKYEWDLDGNGTYETTGRTVSRRYTSTGLVNVKLRVTDAADLIGTKTQSLRIHAAPKPVLNASTKTALVGQNVALDATASSDDNGIAAFDWDLDGDGTYETLAANAKQNVAYTTLGSHTVSVRVTDIYHVASTASVKIVVHRAPTASFTDAPSPAVVGEQVTFDGSASSDDDPLASYEYDFDGDGTYDTSSANAITTHTYDTTGTRTVRLRVTDDHGVQDVVARTLVVNAAPPADRTAPKVTITPRTVKMAKKGTVALKVACPTTERSCVGRLSLRTKGAHGRGAGSRAFTLGGGQRTTLKVKLTKAAKAKVKARGSLKVAATAKAKDAAGNTGATKVTVTITR
jgi:PKD repeat protein